MKPKITIDKESGAIYIYLKDDNYKISSTSTIQERTASRPMINIDVSSEGEIVGIEII